MSDIRSVMSHPNYDKIFRKDKVEDVNEHKRCEGCEDCTCEKKIGFAKTVESE